MERDNELLLPMEASDSDDIVEEFKLPPPRTRRPKVRKAVAEARIAASNSSLLSWKCCLMFILVTVVITAALVVAFFMLSMQSEISELTLKMTKVHIKLQHQTRFEISSKKLMEKLGEYKRKFSKQDLNNKLLAHKILLLNETILQLSNNIMKLGSSETLARHISILSADVGLLKKGIAQTGGNIGKIQAEIVEHGDKFDSILTELKNVKMAIYKSSSRNKTQLEMLTRPISTQTEEIRKLKELIRQMNRTHSESTHKFAMEIYNNHVEQDANFKQLQVMVGDLNTTHVRDFFNTAQNIATFRNKTGHDMASNTYAMDVMRNTTKSLEEEVVQHHQEVKKYASYAMAVKGNLTKALRKVVAQQHQEFKKYNNLEANVKAHQNFSAANLLKLNNLLTKKLAQQEHMSKNEGVKPTVLHGSAEATRHQTVHPTAGKLQQKTTELPSRTAKGNASIMVMTTVPTTESNQQESSKTYTSQNTSKSTKFDVSISKTNLSNPTMTDSKSLGNSTSHDEIFKKATKSTNGTVSTMTHSKSSRNSTSYDEILKKATKSTSNTVSKVTQSKSSRNSTSHDEILQKAKNTSAIVSTVTHSKSLKNKNGSDGLTTQAPVVTTPSMISKPDQWVDDVTTEEEDDLTTPSSYLMPELPDESNTHSSGNGHARHRHQLNDQTADLNDESSG